MTENVFVDLTTTDGPMEPGQSTSFDELIKEKRRILAEQRQVHGTLLDVQSALGDIGPTSTIVDTFNQILTEVITEVAFECHKQAKVGGGVLSDEPAARAATDRLFQYDAKPSDLRIQCQVCEQPVNATRFAPHLEKCMGLGRSRAAARRGNRGVVNYSDNFKSSQQTGLFSDSSGEPMDDEDDEDYSNKRSSKKKKSMSSAAGASKRARKVAAVVSSNPHYYTQPELVSLLSKICGAISSSTSKLCSHSLRCPQHSDVQRSVSRTRLLAGSSLNELESTITVQKHTLKVLVKEAGTAAGTSAAPDAMEIQSDILEI
eukprot:TRINITY_DN1975_c0_g1_i1.p1 TRINITY_DN1975_c0_g1~~TRINITY_DN1975_c0_g1_i1.p1  ORF type:complete len:317 (+),score=45.06 TRINITY_DN1975_c0_g1_i1:155-1105(+)